MFTADRRKMGELVAPRWVTALAALTAAIIIALNIKLLARPGAWGDAGRIRVGQSLWLDAGELDHLAPFLGFVGDQLAELGRRTGSGTPPRSARRAFSFGSASPALTALFSTSTTSAGVLRGAPMP